MPDGTFPGGGIPGPVRGVHSPAATTRALPNGTISVSTIAMHATIAKRSGRITRHDARATRSVAACSLAFALPTVTRAGGAHRSLRRAPLRLGLRLLRLAFRRTRLVHRRGGDALGGVLWSTALFLLGLDVVVLALAF